MKKKKGAALPTAIILCMFMLVVSFAVSYLVVDNFTINLITQFDNNAELTFISSHNQYVKSHGDITAITDETYSYKDYEKTNNNNIKALVAYHKVDNSIQFYSIYDFEHDKVLAYQTSDFYITNDGVYDYVGGLVALRND